MPKGKGKKAKDAQADASNAIQESLKDRDGDGAAGSPRAKKAKKGKVQPSQVLHDNPPFGFDSASGVISMIDGGKAVDLGETAIRRDDVVSETEGSGGINALLKKAGLGGVVAQLKSRGIGIEELKRWDKKKVSEELGVSLGQRKDLEKALGLHAGFRGGLCTMTVVSSSRLRHWLHACILRLKGGADLHSKMQRAEDVFAGDWEDEVEGGGGMEAEAANGDWDEAMGAAESGRKNVPAGDKDAFVDARENLLRQHQVGDWDDHSVASTSGIGGQMRPGIQQHAGRRSEILGRKLYGRAGDWDDNAVQNGKGHARREGIAGDCNAEYEDDDMAFVNAARAEDHDVQDEVEVSDDSAEKVMLHEDGRGLSIMEILGELGKLDDHRALECSIEKGEEGLQRLHLHVEIFAEKRESDVKRTAKRGFGSIHHL